MDKIYAIIPVNQFANAKTRLSPFLSPEERKNLLKAMLKDIAITLKPIVDDIIIISKDEEVLAYAEELELTALVEEDHKPSKTSKNGDEGPLNKALKQATPSITLPKHLGQIHSCFFRRILADFLSSKGAAGRMS